MITGRFDVATSTACWTKAYVGMHTLEYSGLYCRRAICGDWVLMGHSGGFWIWPESETETEYAAREVEIEEPVVTEPGREPVPIRGAICSALGRFVGIARIENQLYWESRP